MRLGASWNRLVISQLNSMYEIYLPNLKVAHGQHPSRFEEEQKRENDVEEMICDLTVQSDSYPDIHARVQDVAYQSAVFTEIACQKNTPDCATLKTHLEEMVKSQSDLMKKIPHWRKCLKEIDEEHKDILERLQANEINDFFLTC
mmetsp:Transcript_22039/g.51866  ORF Transcript_22039/g.51866 Transcript_22039/m.51866 type:complete len:145 (+) Transcript_22039:96-530(+)